MMKNVYDSLSRQHMSSSLISPNLVFQICSLLHL